jgi:hypothetical protein
MIGQSPNRQASDPNQNRLHKRAGGFTAIEALIAVAIFALIMGGVLGLFSLIARATKIAREQTILSALSASRLEIMRNLPYSEVGTASGNPNGSLPDFLSPYTLTYEGVDFKIYYEVTYVDDPSDGTILAGTDPAPNDYKQVKMYIENQTSGKVNSFVTNVSPRGLEGINNAGAMVIEVFNASGIPVENATVLIDNLQVIPNIHLSRSTDASGRWVEVGLPVSVNGYHITVSKPGYTVDSTYPLTVLNPNPTKPDATVANGAVTSVSFAIDLPSDLTIRTLDSSCNSLGGIDMRVRGSKIIGVAPDVYKYDVDHTSVGGTISLNDVEWDVFLPTLVSGQPYTLYGTSPIQQVNVLPNATQTFTLILGAPSANSLLVIVKNAVTGAPIEGAEVNLTKAGVPDIQYTGGSVWNQNNWSAGPGQADFLARNRYWADDGNIDNTGSGIQLETIGADYVPAGQLESSTFDTGAASNFTILEWEPTSQVPGTSVSFQLASNNDNFTWNYVGPDGTAATYYTVPGTTINPVHDNNRYIRYRVNLESTDPQFTATLSNVNVNYVSGCNTPGQTVYAGLVAANDYDLDVTMPGYSSFSATGLNINGHQTIEVLLTP